ncbi:transposase [Streptomyces sp. NPDC094143]|uniref:transposase n=1 Tax=Streptomyces sp. NPDC094143 TaxID=3155310 RepID=UPI0033339690
MGDLRGLHRQVLCAGSWGCGRLGSLEQEGIGGRVAGRWRDHRQVLEGIVFKFRTGVPWRDLPERFGPWQTVHGRFARWAADGTFDRLLAAAQQRAEVDWMVALDSTIVRAHQHTAAKGAR